MELSLIHRTIYKNENKVYNTIENKIINNFIVKYVLIAQQDRAVAS